MSKRTRQVAGAMCDATGLSQEEIALLVAATALATTLIGLLKAFDLVIDAWPGALRPPSSASASGTSTNSTYAASA